MNTEMISSAIISGVSHVKGDEGGRTACLPPVRGALRVRDAELQQDQADGNDARADPVHPPVRVEVSIGHDDKVPDKRHGESDAAETPQRGAPAGRRVRRQQSANNKTQPAADGPAGGEGRERATPCPPAKCRRDDPDPRRDTRCAPHARERAGHHEGGGILHPPADEVPERVPRYAEDEDHLAPVHVCEPAREEEEAPVRERKSRGDPLQLGFGDRQVGHDRREGDGQAHGASAGEGHGGRRDGHDADRARHAERRVLGRWRERAPPGYTRCDALRGRRRKLGSDAGTVGAGGCEAYAG